MKTIFKIEKSDNGDVVLTGSLNLHEVAGPIYVAMKKSPGFELAVLATAAYYLDELGMDGNYIKEFLKKKYAPKK